MKRNVVTRLAIAATVVFSAGSVFAEDVGKLDLEDVSAWINEVPGGPRSLHVRELRIWAPNPCHTAALDVADISKSNPPMYRVEVKLTPPKEGTICTMDVSKITAAPFDYPDYLGDKKIEIFFGSGKGQLVDLEVAQ